jgi:hypothetical protein
MVLENVFERQVKMKNQNLFSLKIKSTSNQFYPVAMTHFASIPDMVLGSDTVESAHDVLARLKDLQTQLNGMVREARPEEALSQMAARATPDESLPLDQQLKKMEDRMMARFQASENYLTGQMEEQSLAIGMMVGIFVMSALYIFYYLIENLLRVRRCRCPQLDGWDMVVKAAKFSQQQQQQQMQQPSQSTAAPTPQAATVTAAA